MNVLLDFCTTFIIWTHTGKVFQPRRNITVLEKWYWKFYKVKRFSKWLFLILCLNCIKYTYNGRIISASLYNYSFPKLLTSVDLTGIWCLGDKVLGESNFDLYWSNITPAYHEARIPKYILTYKTFVGIPAHNTRTDKI